MKHPIDAPLPITEQGAVSAELHVPGDSRPVILDAYRTDATPGVRNRAEAEKSLRKQLQPKLADLHDRLMAAGQHGVLVVLQGLDGSGKSGTVKHVGASLNPTGLSVASFKEPDPAEEAEHFLERIRRQLPEPGTITFFDRSHYEDAIVPRSIGELDDDEFQQRLEEIRSFEVELAHAGIVVVKCLLHISYDEQRERFLRRLRRPDKQWKFSESDLDTRDNWSPLQAAYAGVIGPTSIDVAPWFVVPADHKWYRNWAVASILAEHLEALGSDYPPLDGDIEAFRARLQPPH